MLTRLKISGFKNLVDVDVHFGPFTCVAGATGTGKSNLFDAISFLSALADQSLHEAALSLRVPGSDIRSLFHRVGESYVDKISFAAEMIVPSESIDDLGQRITPTSTTLRYSLTLQYRPDGRLEVSHEQLDSLEEMMPFFVAKNRLSAFQTLEINHDGADGQSCKVSIPESAQTCISRINDAVRYPTIVMARQEIRSWQILQLDPAKLRQSNDRYTTPFLQANTFQLTATIYALAHAHKPGSRPDPATVYAQITERLAQLNPEVESISVDYDPKQAKLTLQVADIHSAVHPAHELSDSTLRLLSLVVLELTPHNGLICWESPENGMHPSSIALILQILQQMAIDPEQPITNTNPLRQIIISTNSPLVVQQVPADSLVIAELTDTQRDHQYFPRANFTYLPHTWRHITDRNPDKNIVAPDSLLGYLNPVVSPPSPVVEKTALRVIDRPDLQPHIPGAV
jgi:predicted ATPase